MRHDSTTPPVDDSTAQAQKADEPTMLRPCGIPRWVLLQDRGDK